MRVLHADLTTAQKRETTLPACTLTAHKKMAGVERLAFTRHYTGGETQTRTAACIVLDGSDIYLVRAHVDYASGTQINFQSVRNPTSGSTYSSWSTSAIGATIDDIALAAQHGTSGAVVSLIFCYWDSGAGLSRLYRLTSADFGVSFGGSTLVRSIPTTKLIATSAAYDSSDNLLVLSANGTAAVYTDEWNGSAWANGSVIPNTITAVSDVAVCRPVSGDVFPFVICGQDGDSTEYISASQYDWSGNSMVNEEVILKAASSASIAYENPFMEYFDSIIWVFFTVNYSGSVAEERTFFTHSVSGSQWGQGTPDFYVVEPVPFNHTPTFGLAITFDGTNVWLSSADSVWGATQNTASVDLMTAAFLGLRFKIWEMGGEMMIMLDNSDQAYDSPGAGSIIPVDKGCEIRLALGYTDANGTDRNSPMHYFEVVSYEHIATAGRARFGLNCSDGWTRLRQWTPRFQFRYNADGDTDKTVFQMLQVFLSRVGVYLNDTDSSTQAGTFYPDFIAEPGESGDNIVRRLLAFLPDKLRLDLEKAEIIDPETGDSSDYTYVHPYDRTNHTIIDMIKTERLPTLNRARVEGKNGGNPIIKTRWDWDSIVLAGDRMAHIYDLNVDSEAECNERGDAWLRRTAVASQGGTATTPVNCGQELYDVVTITHAAAAMSAATRRVLAIQVAYSRDDRARYSQTLSLGKV